MPERLTTNCWECGRQVPIRKDGRLRIHDDWTLTADGRLSQPKFRCPGGGWIAPELKHEMEQHGCTPKEGTDEMDRVLGEPPHGGGDADFLRDFLSRQPDQGSSGGECERCGGTREIGEEIGGRGERWEPCPDCTKQPDTPELEGEGRGDFLVSVIHGINHSTAVRKAALERFKLVEAAEDTERALAHALDAAVFVARTQEPDWTAPSEGTWVRERLDEHGEEAVRIGTKDQLEGLTEECPVCEADDSGGGYDEPPSAMSTCTNCVGGRVAKQPQPKQVEEEGDWPPELTVGRETLGGRTTEMFLIPPGDVADRSAGEFVRTRRYGLADSSPTEEEG